MILTKIKRKSNRSPFFLLFLDDGDQPINIHQEVYYRTPLQEGQAISQEKIEEILQEDELFRCRQKAWNKLVKQLRSRHELSQALRKSFTTPTINKVLDDLEEKNFLNDEQFALLYSRQLINSGKYGRRMIVQKLKQKGVAEALIDQALEAELEDETQQATAQKLFDKWLRKQRNLEELTPQDMYKRKNRALQYLISRGVELDSAREIVQDSWPD